MFNEDEERKGLPIKTFLISLLIIIILVLLLIWLLPMPNLKGLNNRIFNSNVSEMKDAATSYFTTDKLPQEEGDSVKLTLQEMLDKKLLLPFTDKNGDACDTQNSYVLLTKKANEYEMKVNLKCNEEEDYILVTMGCYSYCTSAICEDKTKEEEKEKEKKGLGCELYVANGSKNGSTYTSNVEVKLRKIGDEEITNYGIGLDSSFNKKDSYTVSNNGITVVRGIVQDKNGKTATCNITIRKNDTPPTPTPEPTPEPTPTPTGPSCTLVIEGDKKVGEYYTGNVSVKWGSKTSGSKIVGYGISTTGVSYSGNDVFEVKAEGTSTVYGYVKDANGKTATCSVIVKKDTTRPDCSLFVVSGSKNENGSFISDVVIGLDKGDLVSGVKEYGILNSSTPVYNGNDRYTITTNGTHKVYGYVRDNAGNTAICNINVKRQKEETPKESIPSCSLKVISGTEGENGWYVSSVKVGFDTKTTTNGATITGYGLGATENYNGSNEYLIIYDGSSTAYGYVKDSYGNTGVCSLRVKKDTTKPSCSLKVVSGDIDSDGKYTDDIMVGYNYVRDTVSGIAGYGIGKTVNYNRDNYYIVNTAGTHTIYGYAKDLAGNTNTCSIEVTRKNAVEYQYKKEVGAVYGEWSNWQTYTYSLDKKPQFGNYELIEIVDLGKTTAIDHYEYTKGEPIYKDTYVKVGTIKQNYCTDYEYYRTTTVTTETTVTEGGSSGGTTYAVSNNSKWTSTRVATTGVPRDTLAVRYEFVGFDWSSCDGCVTAPKKIWNKYTRDGWGYVPGDSSSSVVNVQTNIETKCATTETKDVAVFAIAKQLVGYEEERHPVYKDVYNYKRRIRSVVKEAHTEYAWGAFNDQTLISQGYTMTDNTRIVY